MEASAPPYQRERPVPLHPLIYLEDGDEVTIGRPDTDSYGIFPADGAELVRRLQAGASPAEVDRWYEAEYGENADIEDLLAALGELGFIRADGEAPATAPPVRWQRLGAALFSPVAWVAYGCIVVWALVATAISPDLTPTYRHIFFSEYVTIIELALFAGSIPLIALHEAFHALAGRRLGLRSRLRISHRFYYTVVETALDGLVAVPRRQRILPILAGMLIDLIMVAVLTIVADLTREPGGAISLVGRLCLAFAFATLLRVVWQFFFYLRTDLYVLITTVLGCVDLHTTAKRMLGNRIKRFFGQHSRLADESEWHPVDKRVARWYSWLFAAGYAVTLGAFLVAVAPVVYWMFSVAIGRLSSGSGVTTVELLDSIVFLGLTVQQLMLSGWLWIRERRLRRRSQLQHVIT